MILDVSGPIGVVEAQVALLQPLDERNYVKLRYLHLPELPLLDKFTAAVTVNSVAFDIEETSSVEEVVDALDALYQGGNRVCYVWYSGHEFEICAGTQNITLSGDFAAVFKLPTTLVANTCYSSSVYASNISVYAYYSVVVRGVRGMWDGQGYDEVIAKVRRDGEIQSHPHYLVAHRTSLQIDVYAVTRLGEIVEYVSPEVWSLGLEYGVA